MEHDLQHKPDISKSNSCPPLPTDVNILDKIIYSLGIGLGCGLPKKAPGTWGTIGGMVIAIPLISLGFMPFLVITIIASIIGIWICDHTSKLMGVHDDPHIVFDEWAGIWIAMLPLFSNIHPDRTHHHSLYEPILIIAIFLMFRLFDILKPFPIGYLDKKLSGGFGIMLDDILAGLATLGTILLLQPLLMRYI